MIYVCSDIHAEYDLFIKLLDEINFSDNDVMYIGGDVIDKGKDSVRLMRFIKDCPNIYTILGNHEYDFLKYYWAIMKDSPDDYDKVLENLQKHFDFDGHLLDWDTVDYIEALPSHLEADDFILVHAGLPVDENNKVVSPINVKIENLVYDRQFKDECVLPETKKCVFFGHTPTSYLCGQPQILKYKKQGANGENLGDYVKIHLDIGTYLNGTMGCICLDTLEEFYVSK